MSYSAENSLSIFIRGGDRPFMSYWWRIQKSAQFMFGRCLKTRFVSRLAPRENEFATSIRDWRGLLHRPPICFYAPVFMSERWSRWRAFAAMTSETKLGWAVSV
jgi:hypothetical protein